MEFKGNLEEFKVGSIPTLFYIPEFITDGEQAQLLSHVTILFMLHTVCLHCSFLNASFSCIAVFLLYCLFIYFLFFSLTTYQVFVLPPPHPTDLWSPDIKVEISEE